MNLLPPALQKEVESMIGERFCIVTLHCCSFHTLFPVSVHSSFLLHTLPPSGVLEINPRTPLKAAGNRHQPLSHRQFLPLREPGSKSGE